MARADAAPRRRRLARPRNRRSMFYAALAVAVIMVLGGLGVRALLPTESDDTTGVANGQTSGAREMRNLAVGDCLKILPRPDKGRGATGGMNIVHEEVPCDSPGVVTYQVAAVAHGPLTCPNANYQEYWEVDEKDTADPRRWTACLVPNLSVGACYQPDNQTRAFVVGGCGPNALFRVESVHEGDDPRRCTGVNEAFNFPHPARTYCVTSA